MTQPTSNDSFVTVAVPTAVSTDGTAHLAHVQAFTAPGEPGVVLLGVAEDTAERTLDRLHAALVNAGLSWPTQTIVLRVFGHPHPVADPGLDAAFAVALLAVSGQIPATGLARLAVLGELGRDGRLHTVRGVRERALVIAAAGVPAAVVPAGDLSTAVRVLGDTVRAAGTLRDLAAALHGDGVLLRPAAWPIAPGWPGSDLADLPAVLPGRRALEVAAAGGHHLAMLGPPGSGKVMLAQRLPGLLPDLDQPTASQVAHAYRSAGLLEPDEPVLRRPPWRAPHHTSSLPALTGTTTKPGAAGLAHGGVLFLDDAGEFPSPAVRALHHALEHGRVEVFDAARRVRYPTRFQLVLATTGCPATGQHHDRRCDCPPVEHIRSLQRLLPLLDRMELRIVLPAPALGAAGADLRAGESSTTVAARVAQARTAAATRWARYGFTTNAHAATAAIRHPDLAARWIRQLAAVRARPDGAALTSAAANRVVAVAWTLADLTGRDAPGGADLAEALHLHGVPAHPRQLR